ncbi:3-hydroxybutyryl-CoA dehydrogenase [Streptococcus bovimastitidis]|uniref:3-hydroxybutyryl-CoA dehydrogenase n=1 Tax=Streptococcus bovimastitidis TaxID=1856638 RepID=A0A1L8MLH7_9STRE|nr:3-hydroxyacyl-CoA dehydrogenase [Streptococcus bovimastitidis]OJF71603.1 3-hydroxybutyryl-CoA dehydrogenase [Streptococcus bovimastitidis]
MKIKQVSVAGSGILGSQIAFQAAYKGFDVTIYDINDQALEQGKLRIQHLASLYQEEILIAKTNYSEKALNINYNKNLLPKLDDIFLSKVAQSLELVDELPRNIHFTSDMAAAVQKADLVIEAVPERIDIKEDFYQKLSQVAPEHTIFATNSSTLLPSQFAEVSGRPEKFIALHFANNIWQNNMVEIMGHATTSPDTHQAVLTFAQQIGMIPLQLQVEQPGYILNSILVPFLESALTLYYKKVADCQTIDRTWKIGTGAPYGPLEILDIIGIETAYNILKNYADTTTDPDCLHACLAKMLKEEFIDKGYYGKAAGHGFYDYSKKD